MSDQDFDAAIKLVFRDEGGFNQDPSDAGNWTGGRIGVGELRGTNFGISAAAYPTLFPQFLTTNDAKALYKAHWWNKYRFGELPMPFSAKCFDIGINCGPITAIEILQAAAGIAADGIIGPAMISAVMGKPVDVLWKAFVIAIEAHYQSIVRAVPRDQKYLAGWLRRAAETVTADGIIGD